MKKCMILLLTLLVLFSFAACKSEKASEPTKGEAVTGETQTDANVTAGPTAPAPTDATQLTDDTTVALTSMPVSENVEAERTAAEKLSGYDVDLDLTGLGSDVLTAQMADILTNVDNYRGKRVRLAGICYANYLESMDTTYNILYGYDSTGCCAAWNIEFYGDEVPEKYPDYETICVVGTIDTYDENGTDYVYVNVEHFAM